MVVDQTKNFSFGRLAVCIGHAVKGDMRARGHLPAVVPVGDNEGGPGLDAAGAAGRENGFKAMCFTRHKDGHALAPP